MTSRRSFLVAAAIMPVACTGWRPSVMQLFPEAVYLGHWADAYSDLVAHNDATGPAPERTGRPLIEGDDDPSSTFLGHSGVEIAHLPLYGQWPDVAVVLYSAPVKDAPRGTIVCKDHATTKPPGGWRLEDIERDGELWATLCWRLANGEERWVGSKDGLFRREGGRSDLLIVRYTMGEVSLWANHQKIGAAAVDSDHSANREPIRVAMRVPGEGFWTGQLQGLALMGGTLHEDDIARFPASQKRAVPEAPSPPALIFHTTMNQTTGPMTEIRLGNHGRIMGTLERGLPGILTGSSQSAAGDGRTGYLVFDHHERYQKRPDGVPVTSWTAVWWAQPDTLPVVGAHRVMIAKARQEELGRFDAGLRNQDGVARLIGNIGGIWIGDQNGVHDVTLATSHKFGIGYDGETSTAYLMVGGAGIVASQEIANGGLVNNTAEVVLFGYNGGLGLFDGVMDEMLVYDYWLGEPAFEALDEAVTIEHGTPVVAAFSCPAQSGILVTTHRNKGTTSEQQILEGGRKKYDFTGTHLTNIANASGDVYDPSYNVRNLSDISGGCMFGGIITNGYALVHDRAGGAERVYPKNHGGQILLRDGDVEDFLIEAFRFDHCWDPIRLAEESKGRRKRVKVFKCWWTRTYDDSIECDFHPEDTLIESCLSDGCFVFYSDKLGSGGVSRNITTVSKCLVRTWRPYHSGYKAWDWCTPFKLDGRAVQFDIYDSVFRFDTYADREGFRDLVTYNKLRKSARNRILWCGPGRYPGHVPPGFDVNHDGHEEWHRLTTAWKAENAHVPRIKGIDT